MTRLRIYFLLPLALLFFSTSMAQLRPVEVIDSFSAQEEFAHVELLSPAGNRSSISVPAGLNEYQIYSLDMSQLQGRRQAIDSPMSLTLEQSNGEELVLKLYPVDIWTNGVHVVNSGSDESIPFHSSQLANHYRGVVEGHEGSIVALSLGVDNISAVISSPSIGGNLVLGKMSGRSEHILYADLDIREENSFHCLTEDAAYAEAVKRSVRTSRTVNCPSIYIDLGNDVYQDKGSESAATNYITAVFNQVAALYANDNIDITLQGITVWTSAEPFDDLTPYGNYRNSNPVAGSLKAYVNYAFGGGIAWLNGLCGSSPYSVSGITASYSTITTYSWSVEVLAHELGHNLGSPHTHACAWNGDNTAIDGCGPEAGYSEGCDGPIPSISGGTVMSYCHLTSAGINFSNGFGPQPTARIANFIDNANCLSACAPPTCTDGIQNGNETGVDCGGPDCPECPPCDGEELSLTIITDRYGTETTFSIENETGEEVASGGPFNDQNGEQHDFVFCLPAGCYEFIINDSFGDGMCCAYGQGSYSLTDEEGAVLASGGDFDNTESTSFCVGQNNTDCSVFDTAPVDLTKSFDAVNGVQDRVQLKFFKASPEVKYASEDSAACDILFWKKRHLDPTTGQVTGNPIQNPDSILLAKVEKTNNNPLFKWPVKFRADNANNSKRVEPNFRYEWKVRCYCEKGDGPVSPWSDVKIFNTPNFDPSTGIYSDPSAQNGQSYLKSIQGELKVELYPNPTGDELFLNFKSIKGEITLVRIFDMQGRAVHTEQFVGQGGYAKELMSLAHLTSGSYMIQTSSKVGINSQRLHITR